MSVISNIITFQTFRDITVCNFDTVNPTREVAVAWFVPEYNNNDICEGLRLRRNSFFGILERCSFQIICLKLLLHEIIGMGRRVCVKVRSYILLRMILIVHGTSIKETIVFCTAQPILLVVLGFSIPLCERRGILM